MQVDDEEIRRLRGMLAFVKSVEPKFLARLRAKKVWCRDAIRRIQITGSLRALTRLQVFVDTFQWAPVKATGVEKCEYSQGGQFQPPLSPNPNRWCPGWDLFFGPVLSTRKLYTSLSGQKFRKRQKNQNQVTPQVTRSRPDLPEDV